MIKHHCLRYVSGLFLLLGWLGGPAVAADLIYVPVEPCRIADTRATIGAIPADSSVSLIAYGGVGELDGQGGSAGGCPNPKPGSTPVSIAANVTAVGNQATGNGNLVAYPYGSTDPSASLVNYKVGTNIANATIIALCEGDTCTYDFNLQSNISSVPAIVDVQGYFYPKTMKNVITVSAQNADFTNPIDAINAIPTTGPDVPSATNPYLIQIGPGTYDLGSNQLVMREWVDIKGGIGSREATVIIGAVSTTSLFSSAVVRMANNTELTDLTIINTGGSTYSLAILNSGVSPKVRRIKTRVSGATNNYSIVNYTNANPSMSNVNAKAAGGSTALGIWNTNSSPSMKEVTAEASGSTGDNSGIRNDAGSAPLMNNVTASGLNGDGGFCRGIFNSNSSSEMHNVIATASGCSSNLGIYNANSSILMINVHAKGSGDTGVRNDSSILSIRSSTLEGGTYGLQGIGTPTSDISSSTLIGGAGGITSGNRCIYVADGDNNPLDSNCLPIP